MTATAIKDAGAGAGASSSTQVAGRLPVVIRWSLVALHICIFWNLNAMSVLLFGVQQVFSGVILFLCLIIWAKYQQAMIRALGPAGITLLAFYVFYLGLGLVVAVNQSVLNAELVVRKLVQVGVSPIVIVTYALAAHEAFSRGAGAAFLKPLFLVIMGGCFSPVLELIDPIFTAWFQGEEVEVLRLSGVYVNASGLLGPAAAVVLVGGALTALTRGPHWFALGVISAAAACTLSACRGATITAAAMSVMVSLLLLRGGVNLRSLVALFFALGLVVGIGLLIRGMAFGSAGVSALSFASHLGSLYDITIEGDLTEAATGHRLVLAQEGLRLWRESPLVGHGLAALDILPGWAVGVHNTFIKVLGESGIGAFVLIVGALLLMAKRGWQVKDVGVKIMLWGSVAAFTGTGMSVQNALDGRMINAMLGLALGAGSAALVMVRRAPPRQAAPAQPHVSPAESLPVPSYTGYRRA
jgi:O-antigen ligase